MADLILGAANCNTCNLVIKGYVVDNSRGDDGEFVHVVSGTDHPAWPDPATFKVLPAAVWDKIHVDGT